MKYNYFSLIAMFIVSLSYCQTVIDDFTDGNFTSNQTWSGSTTSFSIITDGTLPDGNASTDGSYLASNASEGDVSLAFASTEVSEWRFSIGSPDFNPSSSNYIGVVLMANASFSGDMVNNNFQGYYLRIGTSGTDPIALYRKTGVGTADVGDFPSSPSFATGALRDGLNLRVTRSSSGVFELFYSIGFDNNSIPTTSAGTLTNTLYSTSSFFGVYQNINSTAPSRRVYIDNIELGTVTWDGSEGYDWANDDNWDTSSKPTTTDNVIIPAGLTSYPTATTSETVNSLLIDSGATLVANNAGFSVTNDAIYTRNLTNGLQWYYISSPVVGETYDNAWSTSNSLASGQNNNRGLSWYDNTSFDTDTGAGDTETGYWRYLQADDSNNGNFEVGQGFGIIRSTSGNISFVGNGLYTSSQTRGITTDVSNFNMVGNPFTAYLNLGDFFSNNGASVINGASIYLWNGSSYDTKQSGTDGAFEIAPGQGFFVEAANDTNVTFDINDVSHQGTETFQKSKNKRPEIKLLMSEGTNRRYLKIFYINGTTKGYDIGYDGKLFGGVNHSFAIFSDLIESDGNKYQLQSLPNSDYENMIVPIGITADAGKEITFTADALNLPSELKVSLEDRSTNTFTRLDEANSEYKINLTEKMNGIGRFYLHTKAKSTLSTFSNYLESVSIYKSDISTLRIAGLPQGKANIKLINILGKQVLSSEFTSTTVNEINLPKLSAGVYIVQLNSEAGILNKKITLE